MYFKVIQDNNVVDIGRAFLKYNEKKKRMYVCNANECQFIQSADETKLYHDDWMRTAPEVPYIQAQVVGISETEYMDIEALLNDGEEVIVEQPIVQESSRQEPEQIKPMSSAEMREIIIEQQKQIDELIKKLQ